MPPPPAVVSRVRVAPQRHTFHYNGATDLNVPSLADARRHGFVMTHEEMARPARLPEQ